jgi:hypothetical protein
MTRSRVLTHAGAQAARGVNWWGGVVGFLSDMADGREVG